MPYEITKAVLEHIPKLTTAFAAAKEITPRNVVKGSPLPFHPGHARLLQAKAHNRAITPVGQNGAGGMPARSLTKMALFHSLLSKAQWLTSFTFYSSYNRVSRNRSTLRIFL
ncbi:MAG: TAXI family TRAP transporter solute-binding subunit [Pyrinomonadaceae bacterium]